MFKIPGNHKGNLGWCAPDNQAHQITPGNVSCILIPVVRQMVGNSGLNRIADERWRLEPGLPQLTRLTLNKFPKP